MLQEGDDAPDFTAQDQHGNTVRLSAVDADTVVLYFYPKDNTPGCTAEACSFRDNLSELQEYGVQVLGVSTDPVESHEAFAEKHDLKFPLLADPNGEIVEQYDAEGQTGTAQRVTYVVQDGTIQRVYPDVDPEEHVEQILADLAQA